MEDIFHDIEQVDNYINDVGCFDNLWDSNLESLDKVLSTLEDNNSTVNPFQCESRCSRYKNQNSCDPP